MSLIASFGILTAAAIAFLLLSGRYHILLAILPLVGLGLGLLNNKDVQSRLGVQSLTEAARVLVKRAADIAALRNTIAQFSVDILRPAGPYFLGHDRTFKPLFVFERTWQLFTARFLLTTAGLFFFFKFGASDWFWGTWFYSFVALLAAFHFLITRSQSDDYNGMRYWLLATWAGALVMWAFLLWLAIALLKRIDWNGHSCPTIILGCLAALSLAGLSGFAISTARSAIRDRSVAWVNLFVGLSVFPFCVAWGIASLSVAYVRPLLSVTPRDATIDQVRIDELSSRARWARQSGWMRQDKTPLTVAVALSGGGYRAALIHAGVLQALDEKCVPIRYLTTVSGGSIVGAYYALGYTPQQFKEKLKRQRPGLPDEYLAVWNQARSWLGVSTNAETYTDFFSRVFFGSKVLADTDLFPQLLVNATDIERSSNAREVFFKGRSQALPELDRTRLADVVAASAAFPGVFQPRTIVWPAPAGEPALANRRFVDGGVVENLGYTGLVRFLAISERPEASPKVDYLIISDASAEEASGSLPNTVDPWELLSRSQDISYAFQVSLVHELLDGEQPKGLPKPLFVRAQEADIKEALKKDSFSSPATGTVPGSTIANEVTRYSTLAELDESQVEKAFWLGHAIGEMRWRQIDHWRQTFTTEASCQK
ncbi:patatin-like phospholipase family protein [Bradyrhizobium sp. CCGUVB14]|uniref:patatin-like phospholipase family protein n=1 Tax=Bradyrhizobium sp. CCGUVB14 TaxID=2949628 RepID=UPI0020B3CB05|nr:patatin-like phospholipase family protein [Bradyrhizobium sp. CCGUVB14]MCP3446149.1 patatin-like phospholipase family protein [Bradyrhizobium sp. CCGUVB14]